MALGPDLSASLPWQLSAIRVRSTSAVRNTVLNPQTSEVCNTVLNQQYSPQPAGSLPAARRSWYARRCVYASERIVSSSPCFLALASIHPTT